MSFGELSSFYAQAELIFDATYDIVTSKMQGEDCENIYDVVDDTVNCMTHHKCIMVLPTMGWTRSSLNTKTTLDRAPLP